MFLRNWINLTCKKAATTSLTRTIMYIPCLHALMHVTMLDTLVLHVGAVSSQTLHRLLQVLLLQLQLLQAASV